MMNIDSTSKELNAKGFAYVRSIDVLASASALQRRKFCSWWDGLMPDENFRQYTCRERRILRYRASSLQPDHLEINSNSNYISPKNYDAPYQRGVNFLTYADAGFIREPLLRIILEYDLAIAKAAIAPFAYLEIDIHQFRVKADKGQVSPTTSGIHQDGYDLVFMHFIRSWNVKPVTSEIFSAASEQCLSFHVQMNKFMETLIINDRLCWHRAAPVIQKKSNLPAYRDILVVSFRKSRQELES